MISSDALFDQARRVLPGGVTATARFNKALGRPFYIARGDGAYVFDLDGRPHVDLCTSHGAALLGHNHPAIKAAVAQALELGIICAAETEHQVRLAQKLRALVPCAEMARFSSSGTETMMHGLRLARAATGREKIIKFEGHFHGYSDFLNFSWAPPLAQAGPPSAPLPYPESAGIPSLTAQTILVAPFNDPDALEAIFKRHGHEVAALVMEPINYDSGCIPPQPGFVQRCRELCDHYGALLFFDEVLTAFRMAPGGAQQYLGVTPDLAVLGKAFGGGMPISALVGRREVMMHLKPAGRAEMSGTYLAHLTAVLAADAALDEYGQPGFYERLDALGEHFYGAFHSLIERSGVNVRLQYVGPRFGLYFGLDPHQPVVNYRQAAQQDHEAFLVFVRGCIRRGAYVHVSAHHGFSAAHTEADLDRALEAIEGALEDVKRSIRG
ncbi:MAG: aminotransferase class III-fold pyridoxal phosphate-dependent enzyme [Thermoflexales bacterium]|nr:aminotransferase class III-fold pyridoxal phosphate-dependent enzyme [Thermoflexales bacterium]MDW8352456.1 aminotransferase class III-fold pyridoxal phosphate-dependent enzyme [Anaerolineae bacterium]